VSENENQFEALHEIVKKAKQRLTPNIWDYLIGATETETTMKRNRMALDSLAFRPRVLRDVEHVDTSTEFLGQRLRLPVMLAPIGSLESFEAGGGASAAKAAAEFGTINIQSSVSAPGLEATAEAADNPKIFQLYVRGDDEFVDDYARRAIAAGYIAFCITVDTAHYSRRERDITKRFVKPWRRDATGTNFQMALSWDNIRRFKDTHDIPLILKGIATAEDAAMACDCGVDVVYVSNHGGRQLDHGRGSMTVLPEVLAAVKGRASVVVDGGINRGTDVVKALALGADAVAVGRMLGFGLAADGAAGVVRMLELMEDEVRTCLGLLGVTSFAELESSHIVAELPPDRPHVLSAFPLIAPVDTLY
tara:strand:+ start:927 stop:2015 length:1089 start_codon:yes stop_codon:yes gene_type:complete